MVREIKNDCKHKNGFLFTINYTEGHFWSTLTGSDPDEFTINRYCKDCRDQMGFIDVTRLDENTLATLEFSSPELSEWFENNRRKIR